MMLYPPLSSLVEKVGSRYLLVNLVARRAREISTDAQQNDYSLAKKPVSCAIDEVYSGRLTVADIANLPEAPLPGDETNY